MNESSIQTEDGWVDVLAVMAQQVAPVLSGQQAQGDLLFDPLPVEVSAGLVGNVPPIGTALTTDGHPHVAIPSGSVRWEPTAAWWGVIGVLTIASGAVTVLHEDPTPDGHAPLYLAPGVYEVIRQRQWEPAVTPARATARVVPAERYRRASVLMRLFPGTTPSFNGLPIFDVESC